MWEAADHDLDALKISRLFWLLDRRHCRPCHKGRRNESFIASPLLLSPIFLLAFFASLQLPRHRAAVLVSCAFSKCRVGLAYGRTVHGVACGGGLIFFWSVSIATFVSLLSRCESIAIMRYASRSMSIIILVTINTVLAVPDCGGNLC